eukprot:2725231-Prymnesium_polylepis.1
MIARPHDGLAGSLRELVGATGPLDRTLISRLSGHAFTVSARPAGDTRSGGRSVSGQLGVAVVTTTQEHTSTMIARPHDGLAG